MQLSKKERRAKRKRKKAERRKGRKTMKRIKIPETIDVEDLEGRTRPYPFGGFLRTAIEGNPLYGKGYKNIGRGKFLHDIVKTQCEGEELVLESADYDEIFSCVEGLQLHGKISFQIIEYYKAFRRAETFEVKAEAAKPEKSETKEADPEPSEKE